MTTQNGWNAPYLATKGDTYAGAGGGARPIVLPVGTNGQVLTADSAEAGGVKWATNAAAAAFTTIVTQVFTASGTYTPTAGMAYCIVEGVGGGGSGGAAGNTTPTEVSSGGGGGAGGYFRKTYDAATIGASQTFVIGAGGAGDTGSGNSGSATTFGTGPLLQANGGGSGVPAGSAPLNVTNGGAGGTATGGDINCQGGPGGVGIAAAISTTYDTCGGSGGSSYFGGGAVFVSGAGTNGGNYGGGGSGGGNVNSAGAAVAGGSGADGVIVVTEFVV